MSDLQNMSKQIKEFCYKRDWGQFHDPKNFAISLCLEAAEVLELYQWTKDNEVNPEKKDEVADELSDVLYWVIHLADYYDIDLAEAFEKKMEVNDQKYPVDKFKGKSNKYNEL